MEETQLKILEPLQKISRPLLTLRLSEKGEVDIKGDVKPDDLQVILDASHLKANLYLEHQAQLVKESNQTVLYIGFIFSGLIGLITFCAFNQSHKYPTYQQSQGIENHEFNG